MRLGMFIPFQGCLRVLDLLFLNTAVYEKYDHEVEARTPEKSNHI